MGFVLFRATVISHRLATRLREAGMKVIGIGERKTPHPFIVACDKFIYLEIKSQLQLQLHLIPLLKKGKEETCSQKEEAGRP
jgi:hypothetical protein